MASSGDGAMRHVCEEVVVVGRLLPAASRVQQLGGGGRGLADRPVRATGHFQVQDFCRSWLVRMSLL
jgi:hypothetical protein